MVINHNIPKRDSPQEFQGLASRWERLDATSRECRQSYLAERARLREEQGRLEAEHLRLRVEML